MKIPRVPIFAFLLAASAPLAAGSSATGTWKWSGAGDAGILLKTIQTGDKVRFQLEVSRGAPSYNSGYVEGEFQLVRGKGMYVSHDDGLQCEIAFSFSVREVEVSEALEDGDCGFGGGVHADGVLTLKSSRVPKFSQGDPRESGP